MIAVAEIDQKITDLNSRIGTLRDEASRIGLSAVSGDAAAKDRMDIIRAEVVAATFDLEALTRSRAEAERLEAERREQAEAADRTAARKAAYAQAREDARRLIAKAAELDALIDNLRSAVWEIGDLQKELNRSFHRAGRPFERSFQDSALGQATIRIDAMFRPFSRPDPLEALLSHVWFPLLEWTDEELEAEVSRRAELERGRRQSPTELAAEIAAQDRAEGLARARYESETINLAFGGGPA